MTPPSNASADSAQGMAESAIAQPEQLFRTIFEQAAVGVALIETSTGRFVRANPRYCEIVDLSQEHMTATTFMAITHPDDLQADLDNMEALKAGHVREFSMEKRYVKSDGSIVWVSLVVSPLWNIGNEQKFHIAVVQEITTGRETALSVAQSRATLEQEVAQQLKEAQDSRRQLQAIFEGTSDAVYLKDVQGRYLMFNEAASRYTGKCSGAVLGKDDRFLFPLAEAQALMAQDQRIMSGGKTLTYEETVTTVDGVMRTFQTTKGPMFDAEGGITGLFGISRDITERTQAEVALRESEERFRSVFEHAATGIGIADLNGRFLQCNASYCALLGYTEAELRELDFMQVVHPDDLDLSRAKHKQLFVQELNGYEIEIRYLHKGDREVWVRRFVSLLRDMEGNPTHIIILSTDVTEQHRAKSLLEKQMEEQSAEVREGEAQLARLILNFPGAISRVDRDLCYRYISPRYEEWFGKKADEVIGHPISEVIGQEAFERAKPAIVRVLAGQRVTFENSIVLASGKTQPLLVTLDPELDATGVCQGFAIFAVDITEQKLAEEAKSWLAAIVTSSTDAIISKTREGRILTWNEGAVRLFGYCAAEMVGQSVRRMIPVDRQLEEDHILACIAAGKVIQPYNTIRLHKSGRMVEVSVSVSPIRNRAGVVIGASKVARDISERNRIEAALRHSYHSLQTLTRDVQMAEERERSRLSRELHDEFGQLLSALKFDLGGWPMNSSRIRHCLNRSSEESSPTQQKWLIDSSHLFGI